MPTLTAAAVSSEAVFFLQFSLTIFFFLFVASEWTHCKRILWMFSIEKLNVFFRVIYSICKCNKKTVPNKIKYIQWLWWWTFYLTFNTSARRRYIYWVLCIDYTRLCTWELWNKWRVFWVDGGAISWATHGEYQQISDVFIQWKSFAGEYFWDWRGKCRRICEFMEIYLSLESGQNAWTLPGNNWWMADNICSGKYYLWGQGKRQI